jgi:ankyrin repeat protein
MDIYHACIRRNFDQVKELLSQGEDPTIYDNFAIKHTCEHNFIEGVELLLQDGRADPTVHNNYPIRIASEKGYAKIVSLLLQNGRADPTVDYNYAIRMASERGHADVVSLLLQDGRADVTADDEWAIKNATKEIKDMLIAYKYRIDGKEYQRLKGQIKK